MAKLIAASRKELLAFKGGKSTGDSCQAFAYHGFNGLEADVVSAIAKWIAVKP